MYPRLVYVPRYLLFLQFFGLALEFVYVFADNILNATRSSKPSPIQSGPP